MISIKLDRNNIAECYELLGLKRENIKNIKKNNGIIVSQNGANIVWEFGQWAVVDKNGFITILSDDDYKNKYYGRNKNQISEIWYMLWSLLLTYYDKYPSYCNNYNEFETYWMYKLEYLMDNIHIEKVGNGLRVVANEIKGEPKLIRDWKELKEANLDNGKVKVSVDEYNGWIVNKRTGRSLWYLSTHSFYGLNYEDTTNRLRCYGFNVEIDNWDKGDTK